MEVWLSRERLALVIIVQPLARSRLTPPRQPHPSGLAWAMQSKRGFPKTNLDAPPEKWLWVNLADPFLTNSLSETRSATLLADAEASEIQLAVAKHRFCLACLRRCEPSWSAGVRQNGFYFQRLPEHSACPI